MGWCPLNGHSLAVGAGVRQVCIESWRTLIRRQNPRSPGIVLMPGLSREMGARNFGSVTRQSARSDCSSRAAASSPRRVGDDAVEIQRLEQVLMQRPPAGEREIERAPIHPGLLRPCALAAGFLNLGLKKRDDIFGRQQAPLLPSSLWNSIRHDHVSGESCLTSSVGPTPAMPFGQRPQALP